VIAACYSRSCNTHVHDAQCGVTLPACFAGPGAELTLNARLQDAILASGTACQAAWQCLAVTAPPSLAHHPPKTFTSHNVLTLHRMYIESVEAGGWL
jgi:hypothetical protein